MTLRCRKIKVGLGPTFFRKQQRVYSTQAVVLQACQVSYKRGELACFEAFSLLS
jgi:hypothetical protein